MMMVFLIFVFHRYNRYCYVPLRSKFTLHLYHYLIAKIVNDIGVMLDERVVCKSYPGSRAVGKLHEIDLMHKLNSISYIYCIYIFFL